VVAVDTAVAAIVAINMWLFILLRQVIPRPNELQKSRPEVPGRLFSFDPYKYAKKGRRLHF
jgi:hypothetical protein